MKGTNMYQRVVENYKKFDMVPSTMDVYDILKNKNNEDEIYVSPILYTEAQYQQFKLDGTVAGVTDVVTDKLWWDFDFEKNLEKARKSTVETVKRLLNLGFKEETLQIKFSGNKGFHILVQTDDLFTHKEVSSIASQVSGDLEGFDESVYLSSQLLRAPLTQNKKTGLYSIPLTLGALQSWSIDQIKNEAKSYKEVNLQELKDYYEVSPIPQKVMGYKKLTPKIIKKELPQDTKTFNWEELDFNKKPKFLDNTRWALQNGFFYGSESKATGDRSKALLCLAAVYKNLGYEIEHNYRLLKGVAEIQSKRTGEERYDEDELYNNIVMQVYSSSWKNGQFSVHDETSWLYKYKVEYNIPDDHQDEDHEKYVLSIDKGFDIFTEYAKDIDKNTMKFGIKELDNVLRVQVGHLIGILAGPGIGKTSMALTLLNNTSKMNVKSFFASYDMAGNILLQKLVQRETGKDSDYVYDVFRRKDQEKIKSFANTLKENYENVTFCFRAGQTLKGLRDAIRIEEEKMGEDIKLVIVDYLELVRTSSNDPTGASAEAIQGLREIANEGKVVICLLQPNKMSSKPDEPLLTYNAAKGSSAIAQAVTAMITCHRAGYSSEAPENDKFFNINIVKNRMGPLSKADFSWDGVTGKITSLDDFERAELKQLRALKKLEKEDKDDF